MTDTIYACASAPGRAGVAVVRVSGPQSFDTLGQLSDQPLPRPRNAVLRVLRDPVSRETIDEALVLGFRAPHSYTGEDTVEYHTHGSPAVLQALTDALSSIKGLRLAEPGEFTRRAFENGKMDLTGAEAVADLIQAETQAQRMQALAQMDGALSRIYSDWSERLKRDLAHLEADLEFPDEDLPEGVLPEVLPRLQALSIEIDTHLNDNNRGERLRSGVHIAVIGPPNAGKSSLVNALAKRDVAIVSDMAGTTRDAIEVALDLSGFPVIVTDTAGLRPGQIGQSGQDAIEQEGIRRALAKAQQADFKILMFDAGQPPDDETLALRDDLSLVVLNKIDAGQPHTGYENLNALEISVESGTGMEALTQMLGERVSDLIGGIDQPALTRQRHRKALEEARDNLGRAQNAPLPELVAEEVRLAVRAIGRITGRVDVEDLLDVIFRDFCIGK